MGSIYKGGLPNVSGALVNWFQRCMFTIITKSMVDFKTVETSTTLTFRGVIQPYTAEQLMLRPEGQRHWRWLTVHADAVSMPMKIDDVVKYEGVRYRVRDKTDYSSYGYIEYHLGEDYE